MKFKSPLIAGRLIRRYKRFMADIELEEGPSVIAHCANPGAMTGLLSLNNKVGLSKVSDENPRLLRYTWEIVKENDKNQWIGVNTLLPNQLVFEALKSKFFMEFSEMIEVKKEVKFKNSRIDFLLTFPKNQYCYLEVKNVHWQRGTGAYFPDSVTARGKKHLEDLIILKEQGYRAAILYIIQRNDCDHLKFAYDIDSFYASWAYQAYQKGVEFYAYTCHVDFLDISLDQSIPILFERD